MIEVILQAERALTAGMVDQAERLYSQAVAHDPRNSIAVVGLARVALERGDDRAAYRLARRALEIDAENVAAPPARHEARRSHGLSRRGTTRRRTGTGPCATNTARAKGRRPEGWREAAPADDLRPKPGLLARLRGRR